jgi:spermidine synthase
MINLWKWYLRIAVTTLLSGGCISSACANQIIKEYKSLYRNITVIDNPPARCIRLENKKNPYNSQSCKLMHKPEELLFFYSQAMMAVLSTQEEGKRILSIGLGGGTMPSAIHTYFKNADVTTVEIDPKMLEAARDYMAFLESPKNTVVIQDARFYVRKQGKKKELYDIILLDAFNGEYIPEHLTTQEFLQEVKAILKPGGLLLSNTFSYKDFYNSESVTYNSVFPDFCSLKSSGVRTIVAYRDGPCPLAELKASMQKKSANLQPFIPNPAHLPETLDNVKDWDTKARIFTDQFSPANLYNLRD